MRKHALTTFGPAAALLLGICVTGTLRADHRTTSGHAVRAADASAADASARRTGDGRLTDLFHKHRSHLGRRGCRSCRKRGFLKKMISGDWLSGHKHHGHAHHGQGSGLLKRVFGKFHHRPHYPLPPDHGWKIPVKYRIQRNPVTYQRYWPKKWYGQEGSGIAGSAPRYPTVSTPTDTTQLGYYYQRVPKWQPNPRMVPPVPWPARYHVRRCPVPRGYPGPGVQYPPRPTFYGGEVIEMDETESDDNGNGEESGESDGESPPPVSAANEPPPLYR